MRRLIAIAACVLSLLAAPATSGAADSNTQRWLVLTRPGTPAGEPSTTEVVATGTVTARGTVTDFLTLNPDFTFDNIAIQHFPDGELFYHGQGTWTPTVNFQTCIGEVDVVGPFVITGGTGAYAGATGEGTALISLRIFFTKTDTGCLLIPTRTYGVAHAEGTLDLP
jgi:hypothetical protein